MLLWIGLGGVVAAVLAAILHPLLRSGAQAAADPDATAVYRDQLAEIEAERERGLVAPAEAEAARIEIARRLLSSAGDAEQEKSAAGRDGGFSDQIVRRCAVALACALPLLSIGVYLGVGAPRLPGQPLSARGMPAVETARVEELVTTVEARLRQHPEDGQGWEVIAPVYMKQGRFREAADAYSRALRLNGESTRRLAGFAEAVMLANDGIVTEPARRAYEKLVKLEPGRIEPRFWLALAKEQDGQLAAAMADYQAFLKEAPPDASWRPLVVERMEAVRQRLGGVAASPSSPSSPKPAGAPAAARGPTADDVAAADRLSGAERQRMIEDMVQGLAERLAKDGRDLAGWQRLIRAYFVMGRKSDAVAALGRARQQFTSEPESLSELSTLARSLGLDT